MPQELASLALDLTQEYPRSPRALFAGYVIVGRILDKCRAVVNGTAGEYQYNYGMDRVFFEFAGIDATAFKNFVATGATDEEVAAWIKAKAKVHSPGGDRGVEFHAEVPAHLRVAAGAPGLGAGVSARARAAGGAGAGHF